MSTQLEGVELFDHVSDLIGAIRLHHPVSDWSTGWLLVPDMLEWLRGRGVLLRMDEWFNRSWSAMAVYTRYEGEGPDLPTALARLVLRVSELAQMDAEDEDEEGGAK